MNIINTFLLSFIIFPISANAGPTQAWTKSMTITSFIPTDSDLIVLVNDGGDPANNPMGCGSPNFLKISPSEINYPLISSTILAAFSQGKEIKVWMRDCRTDGAAHFVAVWVEK